MLIFLDIDGVMAPAKSWERPLLLDDGFVAFSSRAVHALNRLISDDATVMLTTSHKSRYTIGQWKSIFERRGVSISRLDALTDNIAGLSRKDELLNWFITNPADAGDDFVIIDDDKSLNALPAYLKDHLVQTSTMIGLTDEHISELRAVRTYSECAC